MRRNRKTVLNPQVVFQDPIESEKSFEGSPKDVSAQVLKRLKAGARLSNNELAEKLRITDVNVRMKLLYPGERGMTLWSLAQFADACNCVLVISYRPRNPTKVVVFG